MSSSKIKKVLRYLHLVLGLSSGLIVFIVALSGSCYAFEKEIRSLIHRELYSAKTVDSRKISGDSLIRNIYLQYPKAKIRAVIFAGPQRNIQVNLKNKTAVYSDPVSGAIVGDLNMEKEVLAIILKIHRELYLGETGKTITGISALIFLLSLISGLILWWPRSKRSLGHKLRITAAHGKKRLLFDLHSTAGFYAAGILIITALTGLIFSFKWVEKSLYQMTGSVKKEMKIKSTHPYSVHRTAIEPLIACIEKNYPDKIFTLFFPEDSTGTYRVSVQLGQAGIYTQQDHLFFDQYNGELIAHRYFEEQNTGDRLRASNLNLHTGKVLGLSGEILVFLAGLIAASLPVTGFLMWRNKYKKKQNRLSENPLVYSEKRVST